MRKAGVQFEKWASNKSIKHFYQNESSAKYKKMTLLDFRFSSNGQYVTSINDIEDVKIYLSQFTKTRHCTVS